MPKESPQRSTPGTENLTTTTVTNAQLQAMIDQGVTAALVARDANRNGDDSHTSGTGVRRNEHVARECTNPDFLKCKPLNFKGTEGVVDSLSEKCIAVVELSRKTTLQNYPDNTWKTLKKMMTDKYCPRGEIKRLMLKCGIRTGEGYRMW
ncbi:hypothetical protein Tco_0071458 [Tanacetum coccineum]